MISRDTKDALYAFAQTPRGRAFLEEMERELRATFGPDTTTEKLRYLEGRRALAGELVAAMTRGAR